MFLHKLFLSNMQTDSNGKKEDLSVYSIHQRIWRIVSMNKYQKRDFLYRVEYDAYQNIRFIYLLAHNTVTPQKNVRIDVSPRFQPQLDNGEELLFKLRANPIIRKKENGRAKDCDIIMDAKYQFKKVGRNYLDKFSMDELIHNVGMEWLGRKGERHGFSVKSFEVNIDNYREYSICATGKQNFTLRTLDFEGKLKITDQNCFINTLFNGIGRAKAFGCGLMLVRRV